eukprot:g6917.t1
MTGIGKWDVSSCESFGEMFADCADFDTDLSAWGSKLQNAKNFHRMFSNCLLLGAKNFPKWDWDSLKDRQELRTHGMFFGCVGLMDEKNLIPEWLE